MAEFYGSVQGRRGEATRLGSKATGLTAVAASWDGAVRTEVFVNEQGERAYRVRLIPWNGKGESRLLAEGAFSEASKVEAA